MNWNSTEFVWLDWAILAIGVIGVIWAVWHAIVKDRKAQKGEDSSAYLFGKGEPWYVIGMAIFAANIGSEHLVGLAGTGAKSGRYGTLGDAGLDDPHLGLAVRTFLPVAHQQDG